MLSRADDAAAQGNQCLLLVVWLLWPRWRQMWIARASSSTAIPRIHIPVAGTLDLEHGRVDGARTDGLLLMRLWGLGLHGLMERLLPGLPVVLLLVVMVPVGISRGTLGKMGGTRTVGVRRSALKGKVGSIGWEGLLQLR